MKYLRTKVITFGSVSDPSPDVVGSVGASVEERRHDLSILLCLALFRAGLGEALASKVDPLLQVEWLLLSLREILFQAMVGAKLLRRRSVANETETATTRRATHPNLC
jgi:hypothetical protein